MLHVNLHYPRRSQYIGKLIIVGSLFISTTDAAIPEQIRGTLTLHSDRRTGESRPCLEIICAIGTKSVICTEDDPYSTECVPCPYGQFQPTSRPSSGASSCQIKQQCSRNQGKTLAEAENVYDNTKDNQCRCMWENGMYADPNNSGDCLFCGDYSSGKYITREGECVVCEGLIVTASDGRHNCLARNDDSKNNIDQPDLSTKSTSTTNINGNSAALIIVIVLGIGIMILGILLIVWKNRNKKVFEGGISLEMQSEANMTQPMLTTETGVQPGNGKSTAETIDGNYSGPSWDSGEDNPLSPGSIPDDGDNIASPRQRGNSNMDDTSSELSGPRISADGASVTDSDYDSNLVPKTVGINTTQQFHETEYMSLRYDSGDPKTDNVEATPDDRDYQELLANPPPVNNNPPVTHEDLAIDLVSENNQAPNIANGDENINPDTDIIVDAGAAGGQG